MELISPDGFWDWASQRNIGKSGCPPEILTFLSGGSEWLPCDLTQTKNVPAALDRVLSLFQEWHSCVIWKRIPSWDYKGTDKARDCLWRQLVHSLVPPGFSGAIKISRDGVGPMLQLVLAQVLLGHTPYDDVFLIPDHARFLVWIDHHTYMNVQCADSAEQARVCGMLGLRT
jgi:hypothetical protein